MVADADSQRPSAQFGSSLSLILASAANKFLNIRLKYIHFLILRLDRHWWSVLLSRSLRQYSGFEHKYCSVTLVWQRELHSSGC